MKIKRNPWTDYTKGSKAAISDFLTPNFGFFDIGCPVFRIMNQQWKACQRKAFKDKIRVGALHSPIKLFNTPTLIHKKQVTQFEPPANCLTRNLAVAIKH